jgi:hypothetical protein
MAMAYIRSLVQLLAVVSISLATIGAAMNPQNEVTVRTESFHALNTNLLSD